MPLFYSRLDANASPTTREKATTSSQLSLSASLGAPSLAWYSPMKCSHVIVLAASVISVLLWLLSVWFFLTMHGQDVVQSLRKSLQWVKTPESTSGISSPSLWIYPSLHPRHSARLCLCILLMLAGMAASSWYLLRYLLRSFFHPRLSRVSLSSVSIGNSHDTKELLLLRKSNDMGNADDEIDGETRMVLWDYVFFSACCCMLVFMIVVNAMVTSHTVLIMKVEYGVSIYHAFALLIWAIVTFCYISDTILVLPSLWILADHLGFVAPENERSSDIEGGQGVSVMCEICAESIKPGQVRVTPPTNSKTCQNHACHLDCFITCDRDTCPACATTLDCKPSVLSDSCFAWVHILTIVSIANLTYYLRDCTHMKYGGTTQQTTTQEIKESPISTKYIAH